MAKTRGTAAGKSKSNSTTSPAKTNKPKSKRRTFGDEAPVSPCAGAASGTMFFCEDGVMTALQPPTVASYLRFDPAGSGLPYWEPEE